MWCYKIKFKHSEFQNTAIQLINKAFDMFSALVNTNNIEKGLHTFSISQSSNKLISFYINTQFYFTVWVNSKTCNYPVMISQIMFYAAGYGKHFKYPLKQK